MMYIYVFLTSQVIVIEHDFTFDCSKILHRGAVSIEECIYRVNMACIIRAIKGKYAQIRVIKPKYSQIYHINPYISRHRV